MKKKITYMNEPISYEITDNFLPPPEAFALRNENVKITITLSKHSVDFFKKTAKEHHSHYQTMIRHVLDYYVKHHKQ